MSSNHLLKMLSGRKSPKDVALLNLSFGLSYLGGLWLNENHAMEIAAACSILVFGVKKIFGSTSGKKEGKALAMLKNLKTFGSSILIVCLTLSLFAPIYGSNPTPNRYKSGRHPKPRPNAERIITEKFEPILYKHFSAEYQLERYGTVGKEDRWVSVDVIEEVHSVYQSLTRKERKAVNNYLGIERGKGAPPFNKSAVRPLTVDAMLKETFSHINLDNAPEVKEWYSKLNLNELASEVPGAYSDKNVRAYLQRHSTSRTLDSFSDSHRLQKHLDLRLQIDPVRLEPWRTILDPKLGMTLGEINKFNHPFGPSFRIGRGR